MRNRYYRVNCVFHFIGHLMSLLSLIVLLPIIMVLIYWGKYNEGWVTFISFVIPGIALFSLGFLLRTYFKPNSIDVSGAMLICALSWILISAFGAIPYVIGINSSYLNAYFEAMSGFTTTGITVFSGLDEFPRSILFWRALTQWLGGLGILSLFLAIMHQSGGAHRIFGAESHKISSTRPAPGLYRTIKILWGIYGLFTLLAIAVYFLEGMELFDSICHALTTLSTGGFSPHDASIEYYRLSGYSHYKLIEYTVTFFMMLGGINFLIHYRVLRGDLKALWDNTETRLWWKLIFFFIIFIMINHLHRAGLFSGIFTKSSSLKATEIESTFRYSIFQVISLITTTGFGTKDINSAFFPALSKQLFLVMMVIGGCVGSTGGGIKVMRIAVLNKLMSRELFKLRVSNKASNQIVIDGEIFDDNEVHRICALFFSWIFILVIGGAMTALFSDQNAWQSFSGMFSALGNIGPCYISVEDMIHIHPVAKLTYIFGMLAGRLEILPVFLLFSIKAWR